MSKITVPSIIIFLTSFILSNSGIFKSLNAARYLLFLRYSLMLNNVSFNTKLESNQVIGSRYRTDI